jgi:hypothetical protein
MLWSEEVLKENSHEMKRLWLAGTLAAGMCASAKVAWVDVPAQAVVVADLILEELNKNNRWEKKT